MFGYSAFMKWTDVLHSKPYWCCFVYAAGLHALYAEKTTIIYHYHGVFLSWYNKEKKKRKSQSQGFGRPKKMALFTVYIYYIRHLKSTLLFLPPSLQLRHVFFYSKGALWCYFSIIWMYKGSHSTGLFSPTEKRIKVMPSPTSACYILLLSFLYINYVIV